MGYGGEQVAAELELEVRVVPPPEVLADVLPPADSELLPHISGLTATKLQLLGRVTCFRAGWNPSSDLPPDVVTEIVWQVSTPPPASDVQP